jgi:2-polyprenyl-6-methoxyphenol hydroxylase-like FAD-dependent oxidoreductase
MALWLAKSGIRARIIDKNSGPGQASRAMAVQARTLEFYRQMGVADQTVEAGIPVNGGHLRKGKRAIADFPFNNIGSDISPYPFVLSLPQDDHERLLVRWLEEQDVRVEWETRLSGFEETGDSLQVTLEKNGAQEKVAFAYLCGCDGARSTVRETLGLGFPGGTYAQVFYVADVKAEGLPVSPELNACLSDRSFMLAFPVRSTGMFRLIGVVPQEINKVENVTFEDIRPFVKRDIDVDVHEVNWFSIYHVHHRVADHFRRGRIFIAGDAGHIHSPAGGQGMNTGIGDAVNLAWKLAAVLHGKASIEVLDTYEPERIAFARTLVESTDKLFQFAVGQDARSRFMRNFMLPYVGPQLLKFRAARTAQFRLISQIRIQYRHSPLSEGPLSKGRLSRGKTGDVHAGDRLPWVIGQDNYGPLKSLDWQIHVYGECDNSVRQKASTWKLPLHVFSWSKAAEKAGFRQGELYVVRPDGYIGSIHPMADLAGAERYLQKWLRNGILLS